MSDAPEQPELKPVKGAWLELCPGIRQNKNFGGSGQDRILLELLRIITQAERDRAIRGIILNTSGFAAGREEAWEIRTALEHFKTSGKKIIAFFDDADFDTYLLLSVADKIVMDGGGSLSLLGYSAGRPYIKDALKKLGVGVRELRYLGFKSAMETYTRSSLSKADKIQYGAYLDSIFGLAKETLTGKTNGRPLSEADFDDIINSGLIYGPESAKKRGLVDITGRNEELNRAVNDIEGGKIGRYFVWGREQCSLTHPAGGGVKYPLRRRGGIFRRKALIAVIYAEGQTDLEKGMEARSLAALIRKAANQRATQAIVLRINSPGGSAVAADYIAEAVRYAQDKAEVPVVVSMGDVAGSGGYWAAMYAKHIAAAPCTLTGSIGVIGAWFYDKGVYGKIGLNIDTLSRGDHADLLSGIVIPKRDLDSDEAERFRVSIIESYENFVRKVAEGRQMTVEQVEALAQGRIWSGLDAKANGLIDSIDGIAGSIEKAAQITEIPPGRKIVLREYPKPKFRDTMINYLLDSGVIAASALTIPGLPDSLRAYIAGNGKPMAMLPLDMCK
ncbi:protease IV [Spirochaetia bacterium]|nr:protease IV [Spirochaetia bacterium]